MKKAIDYVYMCVVCQCNGEGVASDVCDPYTGACPCSEGFQGKTCSECAPGYYSYPLCQRCHCSEIGTTDDVSLSVRTHYYNVLYCVM